MRPCDVYGTASVLRGQEQRPKGTNRSVVALNRLSIPPLRPAEEQPQTPTTCLFVGARAGPITPCVVHYRFLWCCSDA